MPIPASFQGRLPVPAIAAPMFLTPGPDLVVETRNAGVVGTFPELIQQSNEGLIDWLDEIGDRLTPTAAPFGVNLIVHRSNARLEADLAVIVRNMVIPPKCSVP